MEPYEPVGSPESEEPLPKRPRSAQADHELADMEGADAPAADAGAHEEQCGDRSAASEAALACEHLLNAITSNLWLEDLCSVAMVCSRWREIAGNPEFWRTINLQGRNIPVRKVYHLLTRNCGVRFLNARGVNFQPLDLRCLLPRLTQLESLELEKGGYDCGELKCLSANLPSLTRLVLAGGQLGGHANDWSELAHTRLQALTLERGRTTRLRVTAPCLTSLSLHDFSLASMQLCDMAHLASLSVTECPKLSDTALRMLLCLEGSHAAALPCLTSLTLSGVMNASDETLRLLGRRHTAVASLSLHQCNGLHLASLGLRTFAELRRLHVEQCDNIPGTTLSNSVGELLALEELRVAGCSQVTALRLRSRSLRRLELGGTRTLHELDLRCPNLAHIEIKALSPGLVAAHHLKRILLASHAVERLQWSGLPALEALTLQCPNLLELDLSECSKLKDAVFQSLGQGEACSPLLVGLPGTPVSPGCPRLQVLKIADCEALRNVELCGPALERLLFSQCSGLLSIDLSCPMLAQLSLEECVLLESAAVRSRRMLDMRLGTCPHLSTIVVDCESMEQLDLRGCNQLEVLRLGCPALRSLDATFCSSLGDSAVESVAGCARLEVLLLAVCNAVTVRGLATLGRLQRLRRLDLSYTLLQDPTPLYAACSQLTSLTLANNYSLEPASLLPLFPGPCASGQTAALAPPPPLLPQLRELDVSYCSLPCSVLAHVLLRASRLHALAINGCRVGGVTDALWPLLHARVDGGGDAAARGAAGGAAAAAACQCGSSGGAGAASAAGAPWADSPTSPEAAQPLAPLSEWQGLTAALASPGCSQLVDEDMVVQELEPAPAGQQPQQQQHDLRSLSMVGSGELRTFYLGLVPAAAAADLGLLVRPGAVSEAGQQYSPVDTVLCGLGELRLSLSGRLRSLALGLPRLTDLQLNKCSELSRLALRCPNLQRLAMQARGVGEATLVTAVASCPELQELDLLYCPQVTPEVVAALRAACPSLQTVLFSPPQPPPSP